MAQLDCPDERVKGDRYSGNNVESKQPNVVRALVVHAHPSEDSFSRAVLARALEALAAAGHDVTLHDLYNDGFRPAMSLAERIAYDTDSPILDEQVASYAADLKQAELLVFVYPTWWWDMPAVLKGWFDRVLVPGVALSIERDSGPPKPLLKGLRRVVGITTYGSPRVAMRLFADGGRRRIRRTVPLISRFTLRTSWIPLYGIDAATDEQRQAFLDRVGERLRAI